nr:hypothetical protein [Butyrivibrio sp. Su6]
MAVAGTGYVGLSLAVLLSQHNEVTAVDVVPEKVDMINKWQSPIQDLYLMMYKIKCTQEIYLGEIKTQIALISRK